MMSSITAVTLVSLVYSVKKKKFNILAHKTSIVKLSLVNTGYIIVNNSVVRSVYSCCFVDHNLKNSKLIVMTFQPSF